MSGRKETDTKQKSGRTRLWLEHDVNSVSRIAISTDCWIFALDQNFYSVGHLLRELRGEK